VAANDQAVLLAAQGELPRLPPLGQPFAMVELRSAEGEVISIDYGKVPPGVARRARWHWRRCSSAACATSWSNRNVAASLPAPTAARRWKCSWPTASASPAGCNSLIDLESGTGAELATPSRTSRCSH
jgi:hypothetical protein